MSALCAPCADGEHGTYEDGRCTCCGAPDIDEQRATCSRCGEPIKRYGSDGIWFTDTYDCAGSLHTAR